MYDVLILFGTILCGFGIVYLCYRSNWSSFQCRETRHISTSISSDDSDVMVDSAERGLGPRGLRHVESDVSVERNIGANKRIERIKLIRRRLEFREISTKSPLSKTPPSEYDFDQGERYKGISQDALVQLTEIGYDAKLCEDALKAVGGSDVEAAVDWIIGRTAMNPTDTAEMPPKGVPVLKDWQKLPDGSISGRIYGSPKFQDGDFVETSKIVKGRIKNGSTVATKSKRRYFLSSISKSTKYHSDEISHGDDSGPNLSTHSRFDSPLSIMDKCHNSFRCRRDSLDSINSRFDSTNKSVRSSSISFLYPSGTDHKSQEVCSICLEFYRVGDTVARLKKKKIKKQVNHWFHDTVTHLNRQTEIDTNNALRENFWFHDTVAQLEEATENSKIKGKSCNHWFHEECIIGWLENHDECPLCRTDMIND